jgi:calcineurin-like phosphoesterase family protein
MMTFAGRISSQFTIQRGKPVIWFTSDTHFGHARILELCDRPFDSVEEMNEVLIDNWNSVVGHNDLVCHLGDAVMGTFAENVQILGRLNGTIRLVPGNHDRVSFAYHCKDAARARFRKMYEDQGVYILPEQLHGWPVEGMSISHYPFNDDRYPELSPENVGQWLLHGHVHNEWQTFNRMINVGVDVWDYTPVSFDTIREIIS